MSNVCYLDSCCQAFAWKLLILILRVYRHVKELCNEYLTREISENNENKLVPS